MIKKSVAIVSALIVFLVAVGLAMAASPATVTKGPKNPTIVIPEHAIEIAPGVFDLGTSIDEGRVVQGIAFIHYKNGKAKGGNGKGGGKPGGSTTSSCFAHLAKGAKWKVTEDYIVDATNSEGLSGAFVNAAIDAGVNAWDDGKNEIMFGSIASPGAIAVTIVWGIFGGPPHGRQLVEWDQVYDQDDFDWGDATLNSSLMDLENIAVHEVGHAAGMGHPEDSCSEETMYRFGTQGETKKRDLNAGDIAGVQNLYN
jgi:hypothetical protein